ncbi:hypothetical protein H2201_001885 [Coniosporium apollinis]|uniref:Polyketide synthase n=1 Tax=Coniosporium apollinis TaxID=61459 RepID=A0ABQ9P0F8_9PEZI|nr:hypothetical protein H2201_001885 [Coniosporium apollinis]
MASTKIYLFGDQTHSFDAGLRRLYQQKENGPLTAFFEKVHFALRREIGQLPVAERQWFPAFTSVVDLLARHRESGNNPALEGALTCIHHLACFISYFGEGSRIYPVPVDSIAAGACIGLLAAAAISSAQTVIDLLPPAVEAVLVAFHTGLRTMETRDYIERSPSTANWCMVVAAPDEYMVSAAIEDYSRAKCLSRSSQPYISAVSTSSLAISGPPRVLETMLQSSPFNAWRPLKLAIHAPYHASHLYQESDLDAILSTRHQAVLNSYTPKIPVISSVTGDRLSASSYGALLRCALREILLEPLRWNKIIEGCKNIAESITSDLWQIYPVASSVPNGLVSALQQGGKVEVEVDDCISSGFKRPSSRGSPTGRPEQSKIAIIGYSGRFPDAISPEHFWDLMYQGLDVHREVPKDRWNVETHVDPTGKRKNTSKVPYGCWIREPGLFDSRFFSLSPREADQSDPAQRLAITTAYEALEMAGIVPNRTPSTQRNRVGMFYGTTSDDWREINNGQNIDTYFIPGGNRAFVPGRINYHFKFSGPSISVDTACSSSFAAIHTACNALWRGECDTAVAGGTNILTNPDNHAGLDRGHFLSTTGNCKPFDDGADGYCRADAVGTVVLKRLEDAEADNDPIQGVILGALTNHSAEAVSITRPHAGAQAYIFDKVLNASGIDPTEVGYIEMHGTGTQAGDAVEMSSVLSVFAPDTRKRSSDQPLYLGSAKANVGHAESASGVTSLIKVLLMMQKNMVPPHVGIKTKINHGFPKDLEQRNVRIAMKPTPWTRDDGKKRRVFLNNFSAAGGNTALLLEDAPIAAVKEGADPRSTHVVAVTARSKNSLVNNIKAMSSFVGGCKEDELPKLAYTTTARRLHHNFRVMVSGTDLSSVKAALDAAVARDDFRPVPAAAPKVAFAFTGNGSQYIAMGKQLFDNFAQFRQDIERFDSIGQAQGFPTIQPLIDGSCSSIDDLGPIVTQLGATCMQMALAKLWASWGVKPSVVVGHSLGEYAALNVAGVLSASDAIYLVGKRAQLLQERCTVGSHVMLAVKASASSISSFLDGTEAEVACINAPEETVVSGPSDVIDNVAEKITSAGFKSTKLKVPYAFHSAQVEPILDNFQDIADSVTFHEPSVPIISPLLGEVFTDAKAFSGKYLARHCREPVDFLRGIEAAKSAKILNDSMVWLEIGSHPICVGMIKAIFGPKVTALASLRRNEDSWKILSGTLSALYLAGAEIDWNEYHRNFTACHKVLRLPAYAWDYKNHWLEYRNDFCLTKGDAPVAAAAPPAPEPTFSTTALQTLIEEHAEDDKATVLFESRLSDPGLVAVVQGHKVNGNRLCPSSLYADIGLTLGDYLLKKYRPNEKTRVAMDIAKMSIDKPLIAKDPDNQRYRVSATADWTTYTIAFNIFSVTPEGKKTVNHANCLVRFGDPKVWLAEWKRSDYLIKPRIQSLLNSVDDGQASRLKRPMAYKLFATFVEYDQKYRGMEEAVLDSANFEATARVKFQDTEKDGNYYLSPYRVDSLGHLSGFTMNANETIDTNVQVYLNHGWESMRCSGRFSSEKIYRTYVKMQPTEGTIYAGDVYIFDEDVIVAVFQGVKFQGVPRKLINTVLPPPNASKVTPTPAANPPKAATPAAPVRQQKIPEPPKKAKTTTIAIPPPKPAASSVMTRALAIISEEVGVSLSELTSDAVFADLGVDSLLSLTISGRFREELDLDVESSIFTDCETVEALGKAIAPSNPEPQAPLDPVVLSPSRFSSGITTPADSDSDYALDDASSNTSIDEMEDEQPSKGDGTMAQMRRILSEEIGVTEDELTGSVELSDLGMDSLMALTVLGRLREELNLDLPSDLFAEHGSLDAIQASLGIASQPTVRSAPQQTAARMERKVPAEPMPAATSILLQGSAKTSTKKLFLFPDGSGSSTSYMNLPKIGSDVALYGLNCPFMKTPEKLKGSLSELTAPYLAEVRRRQPKGPYYLGGWSAGGVCAYDAAQQLIAEGEEVARLILLDSPFPIGLEKLPPRLYKFFDSQGMFGTGNKAPPSWLLPHFLAFIESLDAYRAVPFAKGTAPKTHLIWARDGVCKNPGDPRPPPQDDDPKEMKWLLNNRTDFGPNGWDTLVGGSSNMVIESMSDANHFSMMEGSKAGELSTFIARSMA